MGDLHFILRHALTGLVALLFLFAGWWFADRASLSTFLELLRSPENNQVEVGGQIATLVVFAPVIGIAVQGLHVLTLLLRGRLFTDPARAFIARSLRDQFDRFHEQTTSDPELEGHRTILKNAPDDSLFVWLYHEHASPHLIDWARRRRSYYYLGINIAAASLAGLLMGFLVPAVMELGRPGQMVVALTATVVWIGCAIWLAEKMRQDVDGMELAWVLARVNPKLWSSLRPPSRAPSEPSQIESSGLSDAS
jgi:ribose/xylose/arabinose/galactoside ABC-type transport system permease subunit